MCKGSVAVPHLAADLNSHLIDLVKCKPLEEDKVEIVITAIIQACEAIKAKIQPLETQDSTDGSIINLINQFRQQYKTHKKI